jgi:glycerol-3-phosphate dehydrogenase
LVSELKLLIPSPSFFWTLFWYFPGALGYHLIYLRQMMFSNYQVSLSGPRPINPAKLIREYSELRPLHGQWGSVMSEAQMHDSRMNLNSLFTASIDDYIPGMKGATLGNYVEFKDFVKDADGKITGAVCVDKMDPKATPFTVKAKVVVNCAGVHADSLR